jgi:hypothetical protein
MQNDFRPHPKPKFKGKKPKKPLPKRSKKWKAASKADKERMALLKTLPCIVCGSSPVEVHHITEGGRRLGHQYTIPLCYFHHEGNFCSIGNTKKSFVDKFGTELEILELLNKKYNLGIDIL